MGGCFGVYLETVLVFYGFVGFLGSGVQPFFLRERIHIWY